MYKLVKLDDDVVESDLNDYYGALKVSNPYDWFASRCVVVPVAVVDNVNTTDNQYWAMFVNVFPRIAEDLMFCKETVEHDGSIILKSIHAGCTRVHALCVLAGKIATAITRYINILYVAFPR